MTLDQALHLAEKINHQSPKLKPSAITAITLAAEVRRLQAELERLPARRAQPTAKTEPIAPTNFAFFGISESDEEFAERAGRKVTEVTQ